MSDVRPARKKKRKEQKEKAKSQTPDIQIYDYATAPNILDDLPGEEGDALQTIRDARKGRGRGESKRGKKKGALFFLDNDKDKWPVCSNESRLLMLCPLQVD